MFDFDRHWRAARRMPVPNRKAAAAVLQMNAVAKQFRTGKDAVPILKGVDLAVGEGEVVALVGPSGAGKTSLFHIAAGLLAADSGTAAFQGRSVPLRETPRGREIMSLVFQDPYAALSPHLRVRETLVEPLRIRGDTVKAAARAHQALAAVGLAPPEVYLDRYPAQLSGGQRQRVAIARAIITEPALLLADEPTSMLDASAGIDILNLFRRLAAGGMAVLVTIHDLASACYAADRLLILHQGEIVEEGEPAVLLASAVHPLTRSLIQAAGAVCESASEFQL